MGRFRNDVARCGDIAQNRVLARPKRFELLRRYRSLSNEVVSLGFLS
jgi:hypothetical protein